MKKSRFSDEQIIGVLAPRLGLEPGTYGLTGKQARQKPL